MKQTNSLTTYCPTCAIGNIQVRCGRKTKRDLEETSDQDDSVALQKVTVALELSKPLATGDGNTTKDFLVTKGDLQQALQRLEKDVRDDQMALASAALGVGLAPAPNLLGVGDARGDCPLGYTTSPDGFCSACFAGSYFNNDSRTCDVCPMGFYSESAAASKCLACSSGFTTMKPGAKNSSQCEAGCSPGSFFHGETKSCVLCPKGSYSEMPGVNKCTPCAVGLSTDQAGAKSAAECKAAPPTFPTTTAKTCAEQDLSSSCPQYAKQGLCSTPDVYNYCKKSCTC